MKKENEKPTEKEAIQDLREYVYEVGQIVDVQIPGKLVEGLIDFLDHVQKENTHHGLSETYSSSAKEVKEGGKLKEVKLTSQSYPTSESYFAQTPQEFRTMTGAVALDLLLQFRQLHLSLIERGEAKKIGSIKIQPEIKL